MNRAISLFLIGGALVLLVLGGLALGGWYLLNQSSNASVTQLPPPPDAVDTHAIRPASALPLLAGESEATALDDALSQGDWDSAFALLAYATSLNDSARVGNLLLVGSRYANAKKNAQAIRAFQYAALDTTLSPELSDLTRAQNLEYAAEQLHALNATDNARFALDQAYLLAQYSPFVTNAMRAQLLRQIGGTYQDWGVSSVAAQAFKSADDSANAKNEPAPSVVTTTFAIPYTPLSQTVAVQDAISARLRAARDLQDALTNGDPNNLPGDLVTALGDRLFAEDTARMSFYNAELAKANDPLARLNVLREQAAWLALKWRVARLGFGVSLVGEWESNASAIGDALSDTLDQLFQNANAVALKNGDRPLESLLRTELVWGHSGLYRNYDEADLQARLNDVNSSLRDRAPDELRLDSFLRGKLTVYLLVPGDLYGAGEKALPR